MMTNECCAEVWQRAIRILRLHAQAYKESDEWREAEALEKVMLLFKGQLRALEEEARTGRDHPHRFHALRGFK